MTEVLTQNILISLMTSLIEIAFCSLCICFVVVVFVGTYLWVLEAIKTHGFVTGYMKV